ncbi:hypothetical protein FRB99_002077 [Tulasnella sp. 403]|nr:hypothetical protein FRB99_002077 [Tulasnella sp. 403]
MIAPIALILAVALRALASEVPTTQVVCGTQFSWMTNTLGQSPCLVAAYLEGAYWNIPALPSGNSYNGPNANQTNACSCSSVVYNLVSACSACQLEAWGTWPAWKFPCDPSFISIGGYPLDIPSGTAVPHWAYQDPTTTTGNTFNSTQAQANAYLHLPDYTFGSPGPKGQRDPQAVKNTSKTNIGAIVGGTIGGVVFLILIAFLAWWLYSHRRSTRSSQAPSKQFINKWSKEVQAAGPPSKWTGTSAGGDSIAGDIVKEREGIMANMSSPPITLPYAASSTYVTAQGSTTQHSTAGGGYQHHAEAMTEAAPSLWNLAPGNSGRASQGHSQSPASKSRKPGPLANTITPYVLPPLQPPGSIGDPSRSGSSSPTLRSDTQSPMSQNAHQPSPLRTGAVPSVLPSKIEYLSDRRGEMPRLQNPQPPVAGYSPSGSTPSSNRPVYNPDDPATYASALQDVYDHRSSSTPRRSADRQSRTSERPRRGSSAERNRTSVSTDYQSRNTGVGGHAAGNYGYPALSSSPPTSYATQQQPHPPLGMQDPMSSSVHTLPGFNVNTTAATVAHGDYLGPSPMSSQSPASLSVDGHSSRQGASPTSLLGNWGRRNKHGGSGGSGAPQQDAWSPHVRQSQAVEDFDPYQHAPRFRP